MTVSLPGNPTTGYLWDYAVSDEEALVCTESGYTPAVTEPGFVGGGGVFNFIFEGQKGTEKREVELSFVYARPWENTFIDKKNVTVTVLPGGRIVY